jgi:phosphohistidine phosphatase
MIIYVIRHAIAAPVTASEAAQDDSQRPLTGNGYRKMRRIARGLNQLRASLDLILTSPYVRAAETAKIVAKEFELSKENVVVTDHLSPEGAADRLIEEIQAHHGSIGKLALVGHEPSLSSLISLLVSGNPGLSIALKKGSVCRLSVDVLQYGRCATLDWLLAPAQLAAIGG